MYDRWTMHSYHVGGQDPTSPLSVLRGPWTGWFSSKKTVNGICPLMNPVSLTCMHVCALSRFSRVRLFAVLCKWKSSRLLCPWDSLGKKTGVGCHSLLWGSFQPRDWTRVSCIAGGILYHLNQRAFARVALKCVCTDDVHTLVSRKGSWGPEDKYH